MKLNDDALLQLFILVLVQIDFYWMCFSFSCNNFFFLFYLIGLFSSTYLIHWTVETVPTAAFAFNIFFRLTFLARQTAHWFGWLWLMGLKLHFCRLVVCFFLLQQLHFECETSLSFQVVVFIGPIRFGFYHWLSRIFRFILCIKLLVLVLFIASKRRCECFITMLANASDYVVR